jgi:hypothetical protein
LIKRLEPSTGAPAAPGPGFGPRFDDAALAVGILIVATTVLKFTLFAGQPLGLDETFTGAIAARRSVGDLFQSCQHDVYPPLSYIVSWAWAKVAGLSNAALRFPSAVFICVAPLLALAPRRLLPRTVRLTWAALLACWIPSFLFAETARCYALLVLFGTANAIAFVGLITAPNVKRATVWAVISSLFILDHYFAAILIACQGAAYIAVYRKAALLTWPAALAFAPTFASIVVKAPLLISYSRPGVSWLPVLQLTDLPQMAEFLVGAQVGAWAILAWVGFGVLVNWRAWRDGPVLQAGDPIHAIRLTTLLAVVATAICLGLGFLKAILILRYLTPFVPGLTLGLAFMAYRFSPIWSVAPGALLAVPVGLVLVLLGRPPTATLPTLAFEAAAKSLRDEKVSRLVFFLDNSIAETAIDQQFAPVGGFFFARAGDPIAVDVPAWTRAADPNPLLLAQLRAPGSGLIWIYDLDRPDTLAIRHPPRLAALDPNLDCHNFADGRLGVVTCRHREAPD